jgi:threonine dehydratase
MKIIVEPSSAVTLALVLEKKIDLRDKKIGLIISGGNVDLARLNGYLE